MKKNMMLRTIAALLAMVLMLAGCGQNDPQDTGDAGPATLPAQESMPAQELELALRRAEFAMLSAALSTAKQIETLEGRAYRGDTAYITDLDGDGWEELVYSADALTFTLEPQRQVTYSFTQSGYTYYTDKDGKFYRCQNANDTFVSGDEGAYKWNEVLDTTYACWNGSEWETVFVFGGHAVYPQSGRDTNGNLTYDITNPLENDLHAILNGQQTTPQALEEHLESIGMKQIASGSDDYVKMSYRAAYAESLLYGMDVYLAKRFKGYNGMITKDIDADGAVETVYVIPNFDKVWRESAAPAEGENPSASETLESHLPSKNPRTAIIVADQQGDQMVFTARCAMTEIITTAGSDVRMSKGFLWLDNTPVYLSGAFSMLREGDRLEALSAYAESYGYSNCVLKSVDVTEFEGNEYLCLAKKGSAWFALVFVFEDGNPKVVLNRELTDTALFLVSDGQQQCLLTYSERQETTWNGQKYTGYDYKVFRIGTDSWPDSLDYQSVGYYDNSPNDSAISGFRSKLDVYLKDGIVVCDPYALTEVKWMKAEDADFGTVPNDQTQMGGEQSGEQGGEQGGQQGTQQPENEEKIGYVQLSDPGAWLNVRQGPGTQYPCVLISPNDPNTVVMVQNGSTVTVLETVETGDWSNPTWVKIRVNIYGAIYEGYSSKKFIKIVGE